MSTSLDRARKALHADRQGRDVADRKVVTVCKNPLCSKPVVPLKIHGRWEFDPYCSTACCKAHHNVAETTQGVNSLTWRAA